MQGRDEEQCGVTGRDKHVEGSAGRQAERERERDMDCEREKERVRVTL